MTIQGKVESAIASLVAALDLDGVNVYKGLGDDVKEAPCVIIEANDATDEAFGLGVWRVPVAIHVKEIAADLETESIAQEVFNAILTPTIAADIQGAGSNLAVYDVLADSQAEETDGDSFNQSLGMTVIAVHTI